MVASRNSRLPDLPAALAAFFKLYPVDGRHLCVALSGGRDSVALLHVLAHHLPASSRLSALHVNHGLSVFSDHWADFCRNLCDRLAVPLSVVPVVVDQRAGDGVEAAARRARYTVFANCAADDVLLAHHQADQAETVLLNLLRGAGVQGLSGMPQERRLALNSGPRLLRPLLSVPRRVLEIYLETQALSWIEDESNQDIQLRRNYLRREVLPCLEKIFPQVQSSLARTACHLAA